MDREYNKFLRAIATNVRRFREQRGLTQWEMAEFGFNYRHYQKLESGEHSFNLYTLFRLAKVLKVKVSDLLP